jgi:hypothetical protein
MLYFYGSTNKRDKLTHPLIVSTNKGERKAFALAVLNFAANHLIGSPKRIEI